MRGRLLGAAVLCAAAAGPAHAQASRAFQDAELGLHLISDAGITNAFHRYWQPQLGAEATASTPFYAGAIEAGLQYNHQDARRDDVPGFQATWLFVGWRHGVALAERVTMSGGMRLGMYGMRFDGDTIPSFRRNESELGVALRSAVDYRIGARWHVQSAASYQVVFTHERLEQIVLSAGLSRVFPMPSWLRDFLD